MTFSIASFIILNCNDNSRQNVYLLLSQGDSKTIMPPCPVSNRLSIALAVAPYVATTVHLLLWLPRRSTGLKKHKVCLICSFAWISRVPMRVCPSVCPNEFAFNKHAMASLHWTTRIISYERAILLTNLHSPIFWCFKLFSDKASTLPYGKAWHPEVLRLVFSLVRGHLTIIYQRLFVVFTWRY